MAKNSNEYYKMQLQSPETLFTPLTCSCTCSMQTTLDDIAVQAAAAVVVLVQNCLGRLASGVSNIIDHTLTKRPIIGQYFSSLTVPVSLVKFFANTIETDNLENFHCTLYRDRF